MPVADRAASQRRARRDRGRRRLCRAERARRLGPVAGRALGNSKSGPQDRIRGEAVRSVAPVRNRAGGRAPRRPFDRIHLLADREKGCCDDRFLRRRARARRSGVGIYVQARLRGRSQFAVHAHTAPIRWHRQPDSRKRGAPLQSAGSSRGREADRRRILTRRGARLLNWLQARIAHCASASFFQRKR